MATIQTCAVHTVTCECVHFAPSHRLNLKRATDYKCLLLTTTIPLLLYNKSVAVRIMEGRLLDFDDQGYLPTPQKDTKQWSAYRQRRQRQREQEEEEEGYGVVHKEGGLRRRHGHGKEQQQGSPVLPPAIKPIGVAPASAGGGGGK